MGGAFTADPMPVKPMSARAFSGRGRGPCDIRAGHLGLGVTVIALIVIASFSGPWTLIVAGAFTAWFILALAIIRIRGGRS
ncbi:hypothetical protein ACFYYS_28345 [Streptomyces sp. NPDC002120]|uniref:hypothetical protein n=1 Tax=Streptomyces sp. NPDC002120 TaxID=3364631 RepID=UPI0036CE2957